MSHGQNSIGRRAEEGLLACEYREGKKQVERRVTDNHEQFLVRDVSPVLQRPIEK